MRAMLALVLLTACGPSKPKENPKCKDACEYTMQLAIADIEKSFASIGSPEALDKLKAELEGRRAGDLETCMKRCNEGRFDPDCALAADTIDAALSCSSKTPAVE